MELTRLIEISQAIGFEDITNRLQIILDRQSLPNTPIVLPLVGEFSSGKTSLINALTEGKALETSAKPTTATIFEIHFGCDKNYAMVKNREGEFELVEDIALLKNSELTNSEFVKVFDTSKRIPQTTLLIDTPGLSSSDPRHRQALVSFLPEADGILLVMDVNAQLTRSTIDFINTVSLSSRPIYLILTKCDTKQKSQIEDTIRYLRENHALPFQKIICTAASTGDLDEMYILLDEIEKDKKSILDRVNAKRVQSLTDEMVSRIDALLSATSDDNGIQEAISQQRLKLQKTQKNIDRFFEEVSSDIDSVKRKAVRSYEDQVFSKLDSLVAGKSTNFDAEAVSIINNNSSLVLNNLKNEIRKVLASAAKSPKGVSLPLQSLEAIDMTDMSINGISYNLNLNEVGHEYDKQIATGVKIAAAVGVVAATAGAASGAVGEIAVGEAASAASLLDAVDTITDVADTVSDVGSIISNRNNVRVIQNFVSQTQNEYDSIEQTQQGIGQRFGTDKGIVESLVGFVTDSTMGKPQRRRVIHEYMDNSLLPSFKSELERITVETTDKVKDIVNAEAGSEIVEMEQTLQSLLLEQKDRKTEFENRIVSLRDYRNELLNN